MNDAPTPDQITAVTGNRYVRLIHRRIGGRYLLAHANWSTFMLGVGVESCRFGLIWFVGPFSIVFAKPYDEPTPGE